MVGEKYGLLTVVSQEKSDPKWGMSRWRCVCECGIETIVYGRTLRASNNPSCGCVRYTLAAKKARKYKCLQDYLKNTTKNGECMEWLGHIDRRGYGSVGSYTPKTLPKRSCLVHRRVFAEVHGFYPPLVMHTCDNRKCINPEHLVAGTHKDNSQDAVRKGRLNVGRNKHFVRHEGRVLTLSEYASITNTPMSTLQWRARNGKLGGKL